MIFKSIDHTYTYVANSEANIFSRKYNQNHLFCKRMRMYRIIIYNSYNFSHIFFIVSYRSKYFNVKHKRIYTVQSICLNKSVHCALLMLSIAEESNLLLDYIRRKQHRHNISLFSLFRRYLMRIYNVKQRDND